MKSKLPYHILIFTTICSAFTLFNLITTSVFLIQQYFINLNSETIKYYYDINSVLYFSIINAIIMTSILYKPLLTSKPLKEIWDKITRKDIESWQGKYLILRFYSQVYP